MNQSSSSLSPNDDKHPFARTVCACENCKSFCKRQSGSLAAGDIERIAAFLSMEVEHCAKKFFAASPGALVKDSLTGRTFRIGTICPKMRKGRCVFLSEHGLCSIHAVAPFGCAAFDSHMSSAQGHERSCYLASTQQTPEYQALRNKLDYATSYKPNAY